MTGPATAQSKLHRAASPAVSGSGLLRAPRDRLVAVPVASVDTVGRAVMMAASTGVAVAVIHCYHDHFATRGPIGIGIAYGRAVWAIMVLNFVLTVALWRAKPTYVLTG